MIFKTADLCDDNEEAVRVLAPIMQIYGGFDTFYGPIATVKVFEDNVLVRRQLEQPGEGRVLVVDGGGSLRVALLGDRLAQLAFENGWKGVVVNGCIRDMVDMGAIAIGVRALGVVPRRSIKKGEGEVNLPIEFGGVTFTPGEYLYADHDGIIVAAHNLLAE